MQKWDDPFYYFISAQKPETAFGATKTWGTMVRDFEGCSFTDAGPRFSASMAMEACQAKLWGRWAIPKLWSGATFRESSGEFRRVPGSRGSGVVGNTTWAKYLFSEGVGLRQALCGWRS